MICYNCIDTDHTTHQVPVIKGHPQDVQIPHGHHVTLEVKAYGTMPLYYQWYFGNIMIPGTLNHTLCIYAYNQLFCR